jgi:sulfonate transport system permease protein
MRGLITFLVPVLLLSTWSILTGSGLVNPIFLPTPWSVADALFAGFSSGGLLRDLGATIWRSLIGFVCAALIGIPIGLLMGRFERVAELTQSTFDFFRSIPATALFPVFLLAFGLGNESKIAIVVYGCSLLTAVNTFYGARQVKQSRVLAAEVMGATRLYTFFYIVIPESMPGIFSGLRISLSMSFVLIIVAEMFIGTNVGLGYRIVNSQMVYRVSDMYAGIFLAGLAGYLGNKSLLLIERRLLHWVGR